MQSNNKHTHTPECFGWTDLNYIRGICGVKQIEEMTEVSGMT